MDDRKDKRRKLILELFKDDLYVPMKQKELAMFMQVSDDMRPEFDSIIDELLNEGLIIRSPKGKLILGSKHTRKLADKLSEGNSKADARKSGDEVIQGKMSKNFRPVFTGTYIANPRGFGFVEVEGLDDDLFIPEGMSLNAFHNDTVEAEIMKDAQKDHRAEARIIRVVTRSSDAVVGTYEASKNFGFVKCDNSKIVNDIFVAKENSMGAVDGHKVLVEITDYGDEKHKPEGKVTMIIGHVNDPGIDILSIALSMGLPTDFPKKVLNQAERNSKPVSEADMVGRRDLRDLTMVTIDSEDAKDLDDAVSLIMHDDGMYELGVHIADVSNYVQENSALDYEAVKRGTSVYLTDRVIPMLPHALSNGICSLNEGEDRLALSCIMFMDKSGNVKDYTIEETVINVNRRMSYTAVKKIIEDNDADTIKEYEDLVPMFLNMNELAHILREKRKSRGSIDFDFPESKIILDESGKPIEIKAYERNEATKLIEDFMLAANETVARHFYWLEIPFLYRIHEAPDAEKIDKLKVFIKNFGLYLKSSKEDIHPKELQKLLAKIENTDEEALISRVTLRSMQQAKYSTSCEGHFGLACDYYTHFTSPIRRYPDLQIHRIIKEQLRGKLTPARISHYEEILEGVALSTSRNERRADEAERETVKRKKAQYMLSHINEIYEGVISGVTNWGIYVELENTVEGMVHVSTLMNDFFIFNESKYELVGEDTGRTFKLGQKVKIMVKDVDLSTGTIDFLLADFDPDDDIHNFYKNGRK